MKRQEALRIVGMFAAAHPAWKATEATVELWCDLLQDLPAAETSKAAKRLVASSDDWPSIAALRRQVARQEGLLGPDVDVACRQFLAKASGKNPDVHPTVDQVAESLGGWFHIRRGTNVSVLVGQFRSLYVTAAGRETADVLSDDVGGQIEASRRPELEATS